MKTTIKILCLCALLAFVLSIPKYCGSHEAQDNATKKQIDSLAFENWKSQNRIAELELDNAYLDSVKTPVYHSVIEYRDRIKYIALKPDSVRLTDSSYCRVLENENFKLWELFGIDSLIIANDKMIIASQDSIISRDSIMLSRCEKEWHKQAANARKSEMKTNRESFLKSAWRTVAIVTSGVLVYMGVSK